MIKLMQRDEKDIMMHVHHTEAFRNFALGKLNESDEFTELYKEWLKVVQAKFVEK